ncbi:MAG TPA: enoyl-CoA hydratase/isomerase family protein [Acidimicrobiia bacterium]|nr:enoyl-CoA hydratase/isomerase family protein [Acidimicrobiia bacterium]
MQTISYEQVGSVGWLRLNRPERLNAMTIEMWEELAKLGESLGDDASLRCLVVIGEGRAFSSGIDVEHLLAGGGGGLFSEAGKGGSAQMADSPTTGLGMEDKLVTRIGDIQEAYTWLADAPYPTIAALRGYALGGGLQLALACDLRIAARGTTLGLLEHKYGLLPDLGGTYWLPRIVGPAKAKELIFTAETIDADEALRIGLVNRLVDDSELDSAVTALAERIAGQPPIAVRGTKRAVDRAAQQSLGEGLREAAIGQAGCIRSADFLEAVTANLEKRAPAYKNA